MDLYDICIAMDYINKIEAQNQDLRRELGAAENCILDAKRKFDQKEYFSARTCLSTYCDAKSSKKKD